MPPPTTNASARPSACADDTARRPPTSHSSPTRCSVLDEALQDAAVHRTTVLRLLRGQTKEAR